MRWQAIMWLTAALVAATSAFKSPVNAIEVDPLSGVEPNNGEGDNGEGGNGGDGDEGGDDGEDGDGGGDDVGDGEGGGDDGGDDNEGDDTGGDDNGPDDGNNNSGTVEASTEPTDTTTVDDNEPTLNTDSTTDDDDSDTENTSEDSVQTSKTPEDCEGNEDLIIRTKSGLVQGFPWMENEDIISYYDIPYGTISNPFQVAISKEKWEHIHCEYEHKKLCPQLNNDEYIGDTDCLTLSIFKPLSAENASVLFHIHAENFITGSGNPYIYGPDYLVAKEIILVLPNYRLGPLGFLCMQNETVPGNVALKDLSLALDWIHNNIIHFGGNPDNIAVSGEGRSGALAGLLALYPMSMGNINKVITESGSFLSYWSLDREPTITAAKFLENVMESSDVESIVDLSLEELDVETIVKAAKGIEFKPCLENEDDDAFMTKSPYATLGNDKIEVSFLIGSAMYAGAHKALDQTVSSIKKFNEDYGLLLPNDLEFSTSSLREQTGQKVKEQYFGEEPIKLHDVENLSLYFTDVEYLGPGIRTARLLVEAGATVYFYEFAFAGKLNRVLDSLDRPVNGAVRGDIIGYLFTQDGEPPKEDQIIESKMVEKLTEMWTNFLNTGIPSIESLEWNKLENVDEEEEEWLLIGSESSMQKGLHVSRLPLWTDIYKQHFIEKSGAYEMSPSVYIIIIFQCTVFLAFCTNVSHMF